MPDQSDAPQSVVASAEQLPPAIRELHRAVLRGFRDSGQVHRDDLRPTAAALGVDLDDALHQLGGADLVHSAPDGQIEVAYPFSRQPTGHTVRQALRLLRSGPASGEGAARVHWRSVPIGCTRRRRANCSTLSGPRAGRTTHAPAAALPQIQPPLSRMDCLGRPIRPTSFAPPVRHDDLFSESGSCK